MGSSNKDGFESTDIFENCNRHIAKLVSLANSCVSKYHRYESGINSNSLAKIADVFYI
jgi:hypothetical protein